MPGITGTLYDETYDLETEAGLTWPIGLVDLTAYDLGVVQVQLTVPRVTFTAPIRELGTLGSVGLTTFPAPIRALGVTATSRETEFVAPVRTMGVSGSVSVIAFTAPMRAMGVTAAVRP